MEMRRVNGAAEVLLIECTNKVRDMWRVRWDVQQDGEGMASYMEAEFGHQPAMEEIKALVVGWYNAKVDEAILSGMRYEGAVVWLSSENQFNYKAAYDLAVQTQGATLPVTFKLGTDDAPMYKRFENLEKLSEFYVAVMTYVQQTLADGWKRKDAIDWGKYQELINQ